MRSKPNDFFAQSLTATLLALVILCQAGLYDLARAASCDTNNFEGFFIGPDNKTSYAVTINPLSWQDAQTLAQSSSGRLAVITSQEQNDAIAVNLGTLFTQAPSPSAGNKAWIGLNDPMNTALWCMEGQTCNPWPQRFSWANGFSAFSNYSSGQPDGYCTNAERTTEPDGNCYGEPWVAMSSSGKWSDEGNHGTMPITLKGIVEWPNQTLDCAKTVTPAMDPPVVNLPDSNTALWCTNSTRSNMVQCLPTTDGSQICPLEQVACQDNCPSGYAWNMQNSRCEAQPQTTTGYAQATQGVTNIVKYEPRGHVATSISDYKSSSSGIQDVVRFTFSISNGQVTLTDECAWGGNGNCGCSRPHWNGWCRAGTDLPETRNGNTLTVTANVFDYNYDPNSAYCDPGFVKSYDGESGAVYCMGCPTESYDPDSGSTYTYYSCTGEVRYGKTYTLGATAMADASEFLACPSGYQSSTPLNQQQCQEVLTVWGNQTGITDCSQPELYSCTAQVQACANGGTLDSSTGICYAAGSPPSCTADPSLPCQTIQGDTSGQSFCSPNPCQATTAGWTTTNDTTTGLNDKTNDGPRAADGTCLGQIYLFNGNDMRCRLFDRYGMLNSYAKLVGSIVLAATGVGAALATALQLSGPIAAAVINATIQIAVNTSIDAATGQLNSGSLISAGTAIVAAGISGGVAPTGGWGDQIADAMVSVGKNSQTLSFLADPAFASYLQQIGNLTQQYSPAIQQGMLGNYSETRCCSPDKLSASCEKNEFKEASLAGNGACHIVGSYCASELLFMCMTAKQTSCCFSSKLARIIHEQGRPQLTIFGADGGWGDPRSPNCRGFTPAEFQSIDMAQIDFSEYLADLNSKVQAITPKLQEHITNVGQQTGTYLPSAK